jgi:Ni,Fe-hydrogenase III large subunit
MVSPAGTPLIIATQGCDDIPTIVDLVPAAEWPEREAHDLYGMRFTGHEPLRPLLSHEDGEWRVPVQGGGVHEVAVGPIHAGVIESGHFRFHNVGERILLLDLRLFYKHRGLERAAEGSTLEDGIAFAQRACAACAVSNSIAYAQAAEQLLGLAPTPELARARTVLLELERLYNHLHDLSAICAGVGFAAGAMAFAAGKEEAQRVNAALAGHRFLFGAVAVGGSAVEIAAAGAASAAQQIERIHDAASRNWREMLFNASVQDRLRGVGTLSRHEAVRLGAVGPAARASGVDDDVRTTAVGLCYKGFRPSLPTRRGGDVAARAEIRHVEIVASAKILVSLLDGPLQAARARDVAPEGNVGVGRVEGPRGETVCCLEAAGGTVTRLHLRTASYRNWPVLARVVPGNLLPDFPLINKSFELCYACADR